MLLFGRPDEKKGLSLKLLPKRAGKVLRWSLEKLYTYLCRQPAESDAELSYEEMLMNIDKEFKRKRNMVSVPPQSIGRMMKA